MDGSGLVRNKFFTDEGKGRVPLVESAFKLLGLHEFEDLAEERTRFEAEADQVVSAHEGRGNERFAGELVRLGLQEFNIVQHAMTAGAVHAVQFPKWRVEKIRLVLSWDRTSLPDDFVRAHMFVAQ